MVDSRSVDLGESLDSRFQNLTGHFAQTRLCQLKRRIPGLLPWVTVTASRQVSEILLEMRHEWLSLSVQLKARSPRNPGIEFVTKAPHIIAFHQPPRDQDSTPRFCCFQRFSEMKML